MITKINEFKLYLESLTYKDSNFIVDYIKSNTPIEENIPTYFLSLIEKDNLQYELKTVNIEDVLEMDLDVKEYVLSTENRYEDEELSYQNLIKPIVIHNNQVLDGYSRLSQLYQSDNDTIQAYVSININENNISPVRFKESNLEDIIDFVDELLYNSKNIDITEKIAGQHLTVNIKNGFVTVNNKDSLLYNTGDKDARKTRYGSEITRPLIKYLQSNKLPDQTWAFEIVNPKHNHDYIKYNNQDTIFVEYTGTLTDTIANEIRKNTTVRLLTKSDIKININKNNAFNSFKNEWENTLKNKYKSLNSNNKSKYYYKTINDLKYKIGQLLQDILVSIVDKKSPIEGIVIGTKTPIKLQTNDFLSVQRVQMSLYSLFKINKDEINYVLNEPNKPLHIIKNENNLQLNSIYKGDLKYSVYDIIKHYLTNNSKLNKIDNTKYKIWLTEQESQQFLNKLNKSNVKDIYMQLYNKIKA